MLYSIPYTNTLYITCYTSYYLQGNEDKIRCILNKADQVDRQKLMRIYGALMWSMGKVMKTPEVLRVYIGSFWDQPLTYTDNEELFKMESADLLRDLKGKQGYSSRWDVSV